jgi:catalase
MANSR